jgi:DNA-binding XRE family transcriptional regulator
MDDGEAPQRLPGFREIAARGRQETIAGLVARRRETGLSQTEVAARMGTSQSTVARLEAGEVDPRLSTLQRYAEALGAGLDIQLRDRSQISAPQAFPTGSRPAPGVGRLPDTSR